MFRVSPLPTSRLAQRLQTLRSRVAAWPRPSVRVRVAIYALVLGFVGTCVGFYRLSAGMLVCDEASFAYTTDRMLRTGDWVVPYIHDRGPHLNATPLFNWLSALTAPLLGDGNFHYRVWSAAFGVGCVLATFALATLLFSAEVGLLSGLLLLGNFSFVFLHGMRSSVMESMLAFFVTAMAICYVRTFQVPERARLWWGLTGLCLGLAVLTKPPAMGGFFFCSLCLHHLITRSDLSWKGRLLGPLGAGVVAGLVALPWYGMIYARVGWPAIDQLFLGNSIRRASNAGQGAVLPFTFYFEQIRNSSAGFQLVIPTLIASTFALLFGRERRSWALLLLLVVPFLLVISNAATKHAHYAYAAFPFLAVAIAACLLSGLMQFSVAETLRGRTAWGVLAVVGVVGAGLLVRSDLLITKWFLNAPHWDYPALRLYEVVEPERKGGDGRVVLYQFPKGAERIDRSLGFTAHDLYYLDRMASSVRATSVADLNRILADGLPTVVIFPPKGMTAEQLAKDGLQFPPDRVVLTKSEVFVYPVMLFHEAEAKLGLGAVLNEVQLPPGHPVPQP